jgi:archaeal flagellin FlaB
MLKRLAKTMRRDERGITGLETAIILIAFVVVASVFAYTVLSAGIFSSQKGQEAVYTGLQHARSTLELKGDVVAESTGGADGAVQSLVICVASALNGEKIDLTAPINDGGLAGNDSMNVVVVSYSSAGNRTDDLYWEANQLGKGNGDDMLDPGETFEMTIVLTGAGETISTYHTFNVEIKPPVGSVLVVERTTPAALSPWMILH